MDSIGFVSKKLLGTIFCPIGFSLFVSAVAILLLIRKPMRKMGLLLLVTSWISLYAFSLPITGFLLLKSLETRFPDYCVGKTLDDRGVRHVVVLGSNLVTEDTSPADRFGYGILRVLEGIRVWREIPNSVLVVSGGSCPTDSSSREAVRTFPLQMGVPDDALIIETGAWDTADEATLVRGLVGNKPFALVTSASHMWRSVEIFRSSGLNPIPCPADFQAVTPPLRFKWFIPDKDGISMSEKAIHEYLGIYWLKLKGIVGAVVKSSAAGKNTDQLPPEWDQPLQRRQHKSKPEVSSSYWKTSGLQSPILIMC